MLSLYYSVFYGTSAVPTSSVEQLCARSHSLSSAGNASVRSIKLVVQGEAGKIPACLPLALYFQCPFINLLQLSYGWAYWNRDFKHGDP